MRFPRPVIIGGMPWYVAAPVLAITVPLLLIQNLKKHLTQLRKAATKAS